MKNVLAPLITLLVAALAYLAFVFQGQPAFSHSWYSGTNDPIYNSGCCGGSDCAPVDPGWVHDHPQGFRLVMTLEQAKTVNPSATAPVDAVIPWSRVQNPPHGHAGESQFQACIYSTDRSAPRGGVICFFATPSS